MARAAEPPASVRTQREPLERVVSEQQASVEVNPLGEPGDRGRRGHPDARLLHAANETAEAEFRRPLEHPPGGADAAALGEFDVHPGDDAAQPVKIEDRDGTLVGYDRQRRALLEPAQLVEPVGRERLLDKLDPERLELGQQPSRLVGLPAGVRVDPDRARVDRTNRPQRLEVGRRADLDLERREWMGRRSASGPFGHYGGLVDADREVRRGDRRRRREQLDEGDSWRAMSRAHFAAPFRPSASSIACPA